ncbi:MAG TPA: DUF2520 domain-containing protein [Microbacteriaceae bacterium]|nr:DUF2520 domain-containing protein [Microbacteriaceae bacterium]
MNARAGRLDVGVIGAGRVGPVLGAGLAGAGHRVVGVATTSQDGRERVAALLGDAGILEIPALLAVADLVLLAVPAEELPTLVGGLAAAGQWRPGQLVAHTAAEHGTAVLEPALRSGAIPLAIHPAIVFTGTSMDLARLREASCAVTAPAPVLPIAQALVVELGAEPVVVAEEDRPAYAEAVATATAFSAEIVRQSLSLLTRIGVERPTGVIAPLIRASVDAALMRAADSL